MIISIITTGNRLIVQRDEVANKTISGLYIPDSATEKPLVGTVIAVSSTAEDCVIKKGDRVMFLKYAGIEVDINEKECIVMMTTDIIGVVTEGE